MNQKDNVNVFDVENIKDPGLTVEKIVAMAGEELEELEVEEIDKLILSIASYNIYLKAQKGMIEAEYNRAKARFLYLLGLETAQINPDKKFMSKEEKEALALASSSKLMQLNKSYLYWQETLIKIKDIPFAIDKKLDSIRLLRNRKQENKNESRFESRCSN